VEERDDGLVVRGAQLIGTSVAIADYVLVTYVAPLQPGDEDYAISIVVPVNAPGLRLYPRRPYTSAATRAFDAPLSSRFDESDSLVVFHDVVVPWENVFVNRDIGLVSAQFSETGANILATYQALVRLLVKIEFAAGLAIELADAHGTSAIPPVQAKLGGDIAAFCAALDAIVVGARTRPEIRNGVALPAPALVHAGISLQRRWMIDLMGALRELGGGGFLAMPSAESYESEESVEDVNRYYRAATMPSAERVTLLRLLWDLVGTEFGGRQLQYEMFFSAAQHVADLQVFRAYDWEAGRQHVRRARELP
jgi:4-hydroxyphenylacetate 3-monooxygenase